MNLAIHGLSGRIELANSFYEDLHESIGKFDFVLANPPFNVKGKDKNGQTVIDPERIVNDPRYSLGLPVTNKGEISNANYLWIQIFANSLSKNGRAGFVMANSAGDATNKEKILREKIIESGIVDVIISVGPNMFLNATLSCTLWFFDKSKLGSKRENEVLFINAQDIFTPIDRAHNTWTKAQIDEIAQIVRSYRNEKGAPTYEDKAGRCRVASRAEIREKGLSLNPGRYIEVPKIEFDHASYISKIKDLKKEYEALNLENIKLEKQLQSIWKLI
jgi:type I restriction enzyme M protein